MATTLPAAFVAELEQYALLSPLVADLLTEPDTSVRLNPAKTHAGAMADAEAVPWCHMGRYLSHRPLFTFDPALHQGAYYVQDASSMAICAAVEAATKLLGTDKPLRYLDACAAPGGKTTAAMSALPPMSLVVANEYDFKRAEVLAENIAKWGYPYAMVTRGDTKRYAKLAQTFDIVSVDAPCSGEGMMRKEPKAVEQWSPGLVQSCSMLQREILANAWKALAPGGCLIYSTCTFNRAEDEDNLQWLVDEYGAVPHPIAELDKHPQIAHGIDTPHPCYRFLPGRVRGEGLFIALLTKPGTWIAPPAARPSQGKPARAPYTDWLANPDQWRYTERDGEAYALPSIWADTMAAIAAKTDVISQGVHVATLKGRDAIPTQELALSAALRPGAFPSCPIDYATAIAYLQRQAVTVPDAPRGKVLLTYDGRPLGFVNNLGNRSNNLYPKAWRIMSQQAPAQPVSVLR